MTTGIQSEPHYEIPAAELAAWLERQGDAWWTVRGDRRLGGLLSLPAPGDELAAMIRRVNQPLLVEDRRAEPKGNGEPIDSGGLDELVSTLGNAYRIDETDPPAWAANRFFFLSWKDRPGEWRLVEDVETTVSERLDAAEAGTP